MATASQHKFADYALAELGRFFDCTVIVKNQHLLPHDCLAGFDFFCDTIVPYYGDKAEVNVYVYEGELKVIFFHPYEKHEATYPLDTEGSAAQVSFLVAQAYDAWRTV